MPVNQFSVPGHSTRREFAVYVVIARARQTPDFHVYVGKTGDNNEGCNPVISRAGNHFSYQKAHSQVRNKLKRDPFEYDYEYFYVTFGGYDCEEQERRDKIDIVNEMERAANEEMQRALSEAHRHCLLNPGKTRFVGSKEKAKRHALRAPDRMSKIKALIEKVVAHVSSFAPEAVKA